MSIDFGGNTISRVGIVDDKSDVRKIMAISVSEADLTPVVEDGPLPPLEQFVTSSIKKSDAIICDYKLNLGKYSQFNGAEAVARFYELKQPALLCTTWGKAEIDAMRVYRRKIPILVRTDDINPDTIAKGFEYCIREYKNDFSPVRKPWRTLVRIEEVDDQMFPPMFFVVLPGWYSSDKIRLPIDIIPPELREKINPGVRFHAQVNKGTEDQDDLYFDNIEIE
jgi:CheY-like chemotaxis protein